jgi:hypothetical protein
MSWGFGAHSTVSYIDVAVQVRYVYLRCRLFFLTDNGIPKRNRIASFHREKLPAQTHPIRPSEEECRYPSAIGG